jgi:hypothetical protein
MLDTNHRFSHPRAVETLIRVGLDAGEMSRRMDDLFRIWGLTVILGATADTISRTAPRNLEVVLSTGAKFQPDTILFAAGRVANTEGLDLDVAGVKIDSLGRILVAGAGLTEEQCHTQGIDYEVGRSEFDLIPRGAIAGRGGLLKLILVGIGQMVIHFGGTLSVFDEVSMNTPTYSYAYKYAAFDAFRRLRNAGPYDRSVRERFVPSYES